MFSFPPPDNWVLGRETVWGQIMGRISESLSLFSRPSAALTVFSRPFPGLLALSKNSPASTRKVERLVKSLEHSNVAHQAMEPWQSQQLARDLLDELDRRERLARRRRVQDVEFEEVGDLPALPAPTGKPAARRLRHSRRPSPRREAAMDLLRKIGGKYESTKIVVVVEEMVRRKETALIELTWELEKKALRAWCDQQRREHRESSETNRKNEGRVPAKVTIYKKINSLKPIYDRLMAG